MLPVLPRAAAVQGDSQQEQGLMRLELPKGSPAVGDSDGEGAKGRDGW